MRVYLADGYWKTGVLHPYFDNPEPAEEKPMFFRSDNCSFDEASRCYVFRLPQFGVAVRQVDEPPEPEQDKKKFGFAFETR